MSNILNAAEKALASSAGKAAFEALNSALSGITDPQKKRQAFNEGFERAKWDAEAQLELDEANAKL